MYFQLVLFALIRNIRIDKNQWVCWNPILTMKAVPNWVKIRLRRPNSFFLISASDCHISILFQFLFKNLNFQLIQKEAPLMLQNIKHYNPGLDSAVYIALNSVFVFYSYCILGIFSQINASSKCHHCKVFSYMQHNIFSLFPLFLNRVDFAISAHLLWIHTPVHVFMHLYLFSLWISFGGRVRDSARVHFHLKTRTTGKKTYPIQKYIDTKRCL